MATDRPLCRPVYGLVLGAAIPARLRHAVRVHGGTGADSSTTLPIASTLLHMRLCGIVVIDPAWQARRRFRCMAALAAPEQVKACRPAPQPPPLWEWRHRIWAGV